MTLDDVTELVREGLTEFIYPQTVATHVTGRAGEFHLTLDDHTYVVTIDPVEAT